MVSCGSVHSPALLLRSGVTVGGNVGRHLRLHPAAGTVGVFAPDEEQTAAGQGAVNMYQVSRLRERRYGGACMVARALPVAGQQSQQGHKLTCLSTALKPCSRAGSSSDAAKAGHRGKHAVSLCSSVL